MTHLFLIYIIFLYINCKDKVNLSTIVYCLGCYTDYNSVMYAMQNFLASQLFCPFQQSEVGLECQASVL